MCMYNVLNQLLKVTKDKHMVLSNVFEPTFCMKEHPFFL